MLAKSLAGHDRNHIYLIAQEEEEFVYLVNGTTKKMEAPKKKRRKHVQLIKNIPSEVEAILEQKNSEQNQLVHQAIKCYEHYIYKKNNKR